MDFFTPLIQISGSIVGIAAGGASCLIYYESKRILKQLKEVSVVDVDATLETLLKSCSDQRIEYVGIRGKISSLHPEVPSTKIQAGFKYVFDFLKDILLNPTRRIKYFPRTHSLTLDPVADGPQLPFAVHIDNMVCRDWCTTRSNAYVNANFNLSNKWARPQVLSEGLSEGVIVTVYGKLQRIGPGEIRIQYTGAAETPYIFTTLSPQELISIQNEEISKFKFFFVVYALLGIIAVGGIAYLEWRKHLNHKRQHKLLKELDALAATNAITKESFESEESHTLCIICKTRKRNVKLLNCSHISSCKDCTERILGICPVCFKVSQLYFSAYIP